MSFTLADIEKSSLTPEIKRQLKVLRQCPVIFNSTSYLPSEAVWIITMDNMCGIISGIVGQYLGANEVQYVTIDLDQKKKAPVCLVWLKKNSKHLVDQSPEVVNNPVIPYMRVDKYSDAFKKFADQFAPEYRDDGTRINRKKRIQLVKNGRADQSIIGVRVDFIKFLNRIFDIKNKAFLETFGSDAPSRPCQIRCKGIYDGRGALVSFRVTKYYNDPGSGKIRPVGMFSDRHRDEEDFGVRDYD